MMVRTARCCCTAHWLLRKSVQDQPSPQYSNPWQTARTPLMCQRADASLSVQCNSTGDSIERAQEEASTRLPRFYVEGKLVGGSQLQLSPSEAKHALKALRLKDGDPIQLCDGQGSVASGVLQASGPRSSAVTCLLDEPTQVDWTGPRWELAVGCASLKGGRADWLVEKVTELGAWALQPLLTERSHSLGHRELSRRSGGDEEDPSGREARWQRVAVAAAKQSLRSHFLDIRPAVPLSSILTELSGSRPEPVMLVAAAGAPAFARVLQVELQGVDLGAVRVVLFVGPEGDFSPEELSAIQRAGALPVGLGRNRLRVETAAVALLAGLGLLRSDG